MVASLLISCVAGAIAAETWDLPSGVTADLQEVLVEDIGSENWVRFRFLAPEIDRQRPDAPSFEALERDFGHLCSDFAIPYLEERAMEADMVVVSLADRTVEFGVQDPEATQYFEQFRIDGGTCVWEAF